LRQYTHAYNASFMGFAPVTNPRIVIVVTINGTEGTVGYGGPTSAPVFREVAAAGLRVMDVPKDLPEMIPSEESGPSADENDVAIADLGSSIPPPLVQAGDAVAADDRPVASAKSAMDQRIFSPPDGSSEQDLAGPRVPNFRGKTVRNVIEQAAALGIPVEFSGSGIARAQAPEPGAILPSGRRVRVQFSR
jgi:cell division protein FtsI (penicillin-binding protein 3)